LSVQALVRIPVDDRLHFRQAILELSVRNHGLRQGRNADSIGPKFRLPDLRSRDAFCAVQEDFFSGYDEQGRGMPIIDRGLFLEPCVQDDLAFAADP